MATEDIERVRYFQRQYLGAADFDAEQAYQRDALRRHELGPHTWGIVVGLDITYQARTGGLTGSDAFIMPGMAVDGYGRNIVVLAPVQLQAQWFSLYPYDPAQPNGQWIQVWLQYEEQEADPPAYGYTQCDITDQNSRVIETYQVVVGPAPSTGPFDNVTVNGTNVDPTTLVNDGSVPYQSLIDVDARIPSQAVWLIPLGYVQWTPSSVSGQTGWFTAPASAADQTIAVIGIQHAGLVADTIYGANEALTLTPRLYPPATAPDPDAADFATVNGRLRVKGRIVAQKDIEIDGGALRFRSVNALTAAFDPTTEPALWITRLSTATTADLHVHIGAGEKTTFLSVNTGPADGSAEQLVLDVKGDGTVDLPTGTIDFGSTTRQMLNLYSVGPDPFYGIGVQSGTLYFRSDSDFCWFRDGGPSNTAADPGKSSGGTPGSLQMRLDGSARLYFGSQTRQMLNLWDVKYGIGVQNSTLYQRSDGDFCWFLHGTHSDTQSDPGLGGTLQMKLDSTGALTVPGTINTNTVTAGALTVTGAATFDGALNVNGPINFQSTVNPGTPVQLSRVDSAGQTVTQLAFSSNNAGTDEVHVGAIVGGTFTTFLKIRSNGTAELTGNLGTAGWSSTPAKAGWGGGIHTWDVEAEGTMRSTHGFLTEAADLAEHYESADALRPGDVVCVGREGGGVQRSDRARDSTVLGIVSTEPGVLLGHNPANPNAYPIALCGRVACRVVDEAGPIAPGDLLTTSSVAGHAMRADPPQAGSIIGKALGALASGAGLIDVFVSAR